MAFLLMDFRPLKAVFEKLFMPPILEKRLNHDAIRTKVQIFKNHLARDILFLRRRPLYTTELPGHFMGCGLQRVLFYPFLSRLSTPEREKAARRTKEKTEGVRMSQDALGFSEN